MLKILTYYAFLCAHYAFFITIMLFCQLYMYAEKREIYD